MTLNLNCSVEYRIVKGRIEELEEKMNEAGKEGFVFMHMERTGAVEFSSEWSIIMCRRT